LNAGLLGSIAGLRAQDAVGIERSNYAKLGGWHSHIALHQDGEFALLSRAIRDLAEHVSRDLGYAAAGRLDIDAMWAIVNAPGASNQAHIHPGSLWSGVYYIAAEEGAGDIEFTDPRTANLMQRPAFEKRPEVCGAFARYTPEPGRLLLFPSWLYHAVHPNLSGSERVIVSFNLSQR
jgi:uncharacterized protein (TIGR02466 family)